MHYVKEDEKTIKVTREVHTKLDMIRAENRLRTFSDAINYLLDKHEKTKDKI